MTNNIDLINISRRKKTQKTTRKSKRKEKQKFIKPDKAKFYPIEMQKNKQNKPIKPNWFSHITV